LADRHPLPQDTYVNIERWGGTTVWAPVGGCVGNLYRPFLGTLERPKITEPGRAFLAGLLDQLRDQQMRDLFTSAAWIFGHGSLNSTVEWAGGCHTG
jgi:hypothetical protein